MIRQPRLLHGLVLLALGVGLVAPAAPAQAAVTEYYVSATGSNTTGDGTQANPWATPRPLCKNDPVLTGAVIYIGGDPANGHRYQLPGFGTSHDNGTALSITCSGTAPAPLQVRPWPGQHTVIGSDGGIAISIDGNHVDLRDFEVAGVNHQITLDQALADWWLGSKYFNGNGIVVNGYGVTVADNVVHDVPGAGIDTNAGADGAQILDNLVYDVCWWSTKGTAGISLVGINDSGVAGLPQIRVSGNIVLRAESRIVSHVFAKGFVTMDIDEGSSILVKSAGDPTNPAATVGTYSRGFDISANLFAWNGKGASLRAPGITFAHNTMVQNGTTMASTGAGIRASDATDLRILHNAVDAVAGKYSVDVAPDPAIITACDHNLFRDGFSNPDECLPPGNDNAAVTRLFADPVGADFTVDPALAGHVDDGVPPAQLNTMLAMARTAGAPLAPTGHCVDMTTIVNGVLAQVLAGGSVDSVSQAPTIVVTFPDSANPTGQARLELRFRTHDGPDRVDLCGLQEDRVYSQDVTDLEITGFDPTTPVVRADLLVNDVVIATDTTAPYDSFTLPVPVGTGTLEVAAAVHDAQGGVTRTAPIRVGYHRAPPAIVKVPANLTITSAWMRRSTRVARLQATLSRRASGRVIIRVTGRVHGSRRMAVRSATINSARGTVGLVTTLPRWVRGATRLTVSFSYAGDADTLGATKARRLVRR